MCQENTWPFDRRLFRGEQMSPAKHNDTTTGVVAIRLGDIAHDHVRVQPSDLRRVAMTSLRVPQRLLDRNPCLVRYGTTAAGVLKPARIDDVDPAASLMD